MQQDYALKAKEIQPKQTEQLIRRKVYIFAFVRRCAELADCI